MDFLHAVNLFKSMSKDVKDNNNNNNFYHFYFILIGLLKHVYKPIIYPRSETTRLTRN